MIIYRQKITKNYRKWLKKLSGKVLTDHITLTSITTAAGFIALSVSPIMPLKHFGLFTAFGIGVAYLLTFTLTPAYLRLMRRPKRWAQYEEDKLTSVEQRLVKWGTVLTQHPGKVALIQLKYPYASSARALLPQLEHLARQYLPGVQVNFGGPAHVNVAMADMVVSSQLGRLGLSFAVVFLVLLVLMVIYQSIRWTILALMPLTLSLLTVFAVLTLGGRYIDIPLAVLASISLGLAVDYAIYVLVRYRSARINGAQQVEATQRALVRSGSIVLLNSMILAAGFSVLVISHFAPLSVIGLLTAGVLIISALVSLVLPILAAGLPLNKTVTHQELGR